MGAGPTRGGSAALVALGLLVVAGAFAGGAAVKASGSWGWPRQPESLAPTHPYGGENIEMAYDPKLGLTVEMDAQGQGRMWLWDGSRWQPRLQPHFSWAGQWGQLVYDGASGRLLRPPVPTQEYTGIWTGADWSSDNPVCGRGDWTCPAGAATEAPRGSENYEVAYDEARRQVVLVLGDQPTGGAPGDTWIWDGTRWSSRQPQHRPGMGSSGAMAFDPVSQRVIAFGGRNGLTATWAWDGADWIPLQTAHAPSARTDLDLAPDPKGRVLLFGGRQANSFAAFGDTWVWTGADWQELHPAHHPAPRWGGGMSLDTAHHVDVLVAGYGDSSFDDTWTWDGVDWTRRG